MGKGKVPREGSGRNHTVCRDILKLLTNECIIIKQHLGALAMCYSWRGNDINSEKNQGETFQGYEQTEKSVPRSFSSQLQEAAAGGGIIIRKLQDK